MPTCCNLSWVLPALSVTLFALASTNTAMSQECAPPPSGAIAWWTFDETAGDQALDQLGGLPGTHVGDVAPAAGIVRGSLDFDGSGDYVSVPDDDMWTLAGDFTIEFWAMLDNPGGSLGHPGDIFIGSDEGFGTRNKWFFALGQGLLNFHINGPGVGSHFLVQTPFAPAQGQWYHLAVTRHGSLYTVYVDGVSSGSQISGATIPNANAPLTIGQAEQIGFLDGRLDELSVYDRALQPEELSAIYLAGAAGKCVEVHVFPDRGGNEGEV
ncbi:LamG domain-containing protein, partial [bacterium]|nr:LamG domain-containing protein [bacterium]